MVQFTAVEANDMILRYVPSLRTFRLDLTSFRKYEELFEFFGLEEAEEALISRGIDFSSSTQATPVLERLVTGSGVQRVLFSGQCQALRRHRLAACGHFADYIAGQHFRIGEVLQE
jgi:hypothetical protein